MKTSNVTNQQILLETVLKAENSQKEPESDFFNHFVCEQILKDYDLSDEDITSGLVDGGDDGGIDGFYIFVNKNLATEYEEIDIESLKKIH